MFSVSGGSTAVAEETYPRFSELVGVEVTQCCGTTCCVGVNEAH